MHDPAKPTENLSAIGNLLATWWAYPDRFAWLSSYLASRSLIFPSRFLIGGCTLFMGIVPLIIQFSPAGPQTDWARWVDICITLICFAFAALWFTTAWPSPQSSIIFVIAADISIGIGGFIDSNHLAGLTLTGIFGAIGGYVAFFHSPKMLTFHLAWSLSITAALSLRVAFGPTQDLPLALAKFIEAIIIISVIPITSQLILRLLGADAIQSDFDALTGILNRRGLRNFVPRLLRRTRETDQCLAVILIDFDKFKQINDTHGHTVGDTVLAHTAQRLISTCRRDALVARIGGEEFVVVDTLPQDELTTLAHRIKAAVSTPGDHPPITASVGAAAEPITNYLHLLDSELTAPLNELITRADEAMYMAKRSGGNRVRIDNDPQTEELSNSTR
ncbi:MAG: GGDEF domain-containing protein [Mycobacteriaceae bacterium]